MAKQAKTPDEDFIEKALAVLAEPLQPDQVEFRVQSMGRGGKWVLIVPYLTARAVMDRFDAAFGVLGWTSDIRELSDGIVCKISVRCPDGTWIHKEDGSSRSDVEPLKGGISGAMKRTAVHFGLGRSLYAFPKIAAPLTDENGTALPDNQMAKVVQWANPQLDKLVAAWAAGWRTSKDMFFLKPGGRNEWDSFKIEQPLPERVSEPEETPAPAAAAAQVAIIPAENPATPSGAVEAGSFEHILLLVEHACTVARFNEILRMMVDSKTLTIEQKRTLSGRLKEKGDTWFIKYNPTTACYLNSKGDYKRPEWDNAPEVLAELQQKIESVKTIADAEACFAIINFENKLFPILIQDFFATCTMNGIGAEANGTDVSFYKL